MTPNDDDPIIEYYEKLIKAFGPPQHKNCRCTIDPPPPSEFDEGIAKYRAKELLRKKKDRIIIPDREEMLGIHLLSRDDQLRPERKDR